MKRIRGGKILGIAVVAGLLGSSLAGLIYATQSSPLQITIGPPAAAAELAKAEIPEPGRLYPTSERVINLADPGGRRYLKVQVAVEFAKTPGETKDKGHHGSAESEAKKFRAAVEAASGPVIEDVVGAVLSARTAEELLTTAGKTAVKGELRTKLQEALPKETIKNVYFMQFVIQ